MFEDKKLLYLIGREEELFDKDIKRVESDLESIVKHCSFLVIGGAGSIGSATVKEIFKRNPKKLHVVDINEVMSQMVCKRCLKEALYSYQIIKTLAKITLFNIKTNILSLLWLQPTKEISIIY